jgi:hypothetical protein
MNTVTIRRKTLSRHDSVVIPREEYEALLELKRFREFSPSTTQKRALVRAEKNFRRGKTLSYDELVKKMRARD